MRTKSHKGRLILGMLLCVSMLFGNLSVSAFANEATGNTIDIPVVKEWVDSGHETSRPDSITVNLLANGTKESSITLSADTDGNWKGIFADKPVKDSAGNEITYTVKEEKVPENYEVSYTEPTPSLTDGADGADHWTITNTFSSEKPDPTVPTGLSGVKGNTLSTVALPEGWTWVDGTTVMSSSGDKTFKANYTDATGTYNNLTNVDVTVKVVSVDYGRSYNHIDVKVDGKYSVNVDGTEYTIDGTLQSNTIKVQIGTTTYDFSRYSVNTQSEGNRNEYEIKVNDFLSSIKWGNTPYHMTNVVVSARMLFETVPDALADILKTTEIGQKTYYYADITDMQYTGVQECTGGKGMRSEGKSGTPTGLDLYITAEGAGIYITKGKLAIEKVIVDEAGTAVTDNTAFTFTVKANDAGNDYTKTVTVKGGETYTLTDLTPGSYTVTETQQTGYAIRAIDGQSTTNYSKDYVVVAKEDTSIPVATFTNTKLAEQSSVNVKKTAGGLSEGTAYPNPTISIYAADAQGSKSGEALWTGKLTANGDTLYLTPLFEKGTYVIEETDAEVEGYDCKTTLSVKENGAAVQSTGMTFTVSEAKKTYSLTVDNQYSVQEKEETIDIPFEKVWDDEGYEKERPDSITVNLLANGTKVNTKTLTATDQWKGSFTGKPVKDKDGKEITYTVTEDVPENYTAKYTKPTQGSVRISGMGVDLVNKSTISNTNLLVGNEGGNYYIWTLQTLTDAQKSLLLNCANNFKLFSTALTLENTTFASGNAVTIENVLTVEPVSGDGDRRFTPHGLDGFYVGEVSIVNGADHWTITNTYVPATEPAKVELSAQKTLDGEIPEASAFTFQLKDKEGKVVQTVKNDEYGNVPFEPLTFEAEGSYTYTISEVAGTDTSINYDGAVYTVKIAVKLNDDGNYDTTVSYLKDGKPYGQTDADITIPVFANTTVDTIDVSVTKVWDDEGNKDRLRPKSVTISLLADGKETGDKLVLTEDNNWKGQFTNLLTEKSGKTIEYTVSEKQVSGYEKPVITGSAKEGFVVTNTHTPKTTPKYDPTPDPDPITNTTNVAVGKVWLDNQDQDGIRPASVTVQLYRNGTAYGDPVTLSEDNNWWYRWDHLDASASWTVDELNVPEGYTKSFSKNAVNAWVIINTHTPETVVPTDTVVTEQPTGRGGVNSGDEGNMAGWFSLMLLSGAALAAAVVLRRRRTGR